MEGLRQQLIDLLNDEAEEEDIEDDDELISASTNTNIL